MKKISGKKSEFNDFRFSGLDWRQYSNEYITMKRTGEDKVVVKVADSHIVPTKYGFALILDKRHVVFLKEWQVSRNFYGNEVLLDKKYFVVKEWGEFDEFEDNAAHCTWDHFEKVAVAQDELADEAGMKLNRVRWAI